MTRTRTAPAQVEAAAPAEAGQSFLSQFAETTLRLADRMAVAQSIGAEVASALAENCTTAAKAVDLEGAKPAHLAQANKGVKDSAHPSARPFISTTPAGVAYKFRTGRILLMSTTTALPVLEDGTAPGVEWIHAQVAWLCQNGGTESAESISKGSDKGKAVAALAAARTKLTAEKKATARAAEKKAAEKKEAARVSALDPEEAEKEAAAAAEKASKRTEATNAKRSISEELGSVVGVLTYWAATLAQGATVDPTVSAQVRLVAAAAAALLDAEAAAAQAAAAAPVEDATVTVEVVSSAGSITG